MGQVAVLAMTSALNPTLVTVTTLMLLLPSPSRLMLGYWFGAMVTSITLGLVIVFTLKNSSAVSTTQHTLSPIADIALGALALMLALVLGTGRDRRFSERRARRKEGKQPPRWQRTMSRGTPRTAFAIGALLTLPGASYLAGLDKLGKLGYASGVTVLVVIGFNLVMLVALEGPLVGFRIAPEWTPAAVDTVRAWIGRHGKRFAVRGLALVGALLVLKGMVGLL
jgi:hypothetical protein